MFFFRCNKREIESAVCVCVFVIVNSVFKIPNYVHFFQEGRLSGLIRSSLTRTTRFTHHLFVKRTTLSTLHCAKLVPHFFSLLRTCFVQILKQKQNNFILLFDIYLVLGLTKWMKYNNPLKTKNYAKSTLDRPVFFFLCQENTIKTNNTKYLIWSWLFLMLFFSFQFAYLHAVVDSSWWKIVRNFSFKRQEFTCLVIFMWFLKRCKWFERR